MTTSDKAMNARTAAPDDLEKAMFFLDLVYTERSKGTLRFRWMKSPTSAELSPVGADPRAAHRTVPRTAGAAGEACVE
jgi:hypothetical protein